MSSDMVITQSLQFSTRHAEQLRAIYLDSFPPHERADFSYLLDSIAQNQRWCFTARQDAEMLVQQQVAYQPCEETQANWGWNFGGTPPVPVDALLGLAIIVPHIASDIHLLEYLAVASNARGRGIGGQLLDTVVAALRLQSAYGLFIEVEPDDEGTHEERQWRAQRIRFYRQHGASVVEGAANYRVPLADRDGTMRMQLLWLPLAASARVPTGAQLSECIVNIYVQSYGLPREHPLIGEMLESGF